MIRVNTNLLSVALVASLAWSGFARADDVPDEVLLDFTMKTPPPADWEVEGYAFGTHRPNPKERQEAAVASRNQRYGRTGRMNSPPFVIDSDYLQVTCAGTFHPTRVAVVLIEDGKDGRSCSPERGYGFLGAQLEKQHIQLLQPPEPAAYVFDVRPLVGTPLQPITVEIDGVKVLTVDLPLAFGSIECAGYLPIYDLSGRQGEKLKVSFHSYEGKQAGSDSAPFLVQREIPDREVSDQKPAFHIHNLG